MNSKQRAYLRGLANGLNAIIIIGKAGVTPELVKMVDEALAVRELVKVGMLDNADLTVADASRMLSERTRSHLVQVIGRKIILYKRAKNPADVKIKLPTAGASKHLF